MKKIVVLVYTFSSINISAQTTAWVISCGGDYSDKGISIGTDSLDIFYQVNFQ